MKIKNWIACVQDRGKWKEVVKKAKTFNQEVQRLEEEEDNIGTIFVRNEVLKNMSKNYTFACLSTTY